MIGRPPAEALLVRGDEVHCDQSRREDPSGKYWVLVRLAGGAGTARTGAFAHGSVPRVIFSTEDARFAPDPQPPAIERQDDGLVVRFERPGALILNLA